MLALLIWVFSVAIGILVVYWVWVIQDRVGRLAREVAEIKNILRERALR
ncbi:MAG: hypothetical protein K6U08_09540 [Firmicutes bacterium]|nr:hypothetical protein [Bacillota bacterium]